MKYKTIAVTFMSLFPVIATADDIGHGTPGNGIGDATDPNNDGGAVETVESSSTFEAWWSELLEDLGFVTPDDEARAGND